MKSRVTRHESGWIGLSLALSGAEIDELIECLQDLKSGKIDHFHLTQVKWGEEPGLADVEFSVKGEDEVDDVRVG